MNMVEEKRLEAASEQDACYIMAVETSCDETSVAVVRDGKMLLSNVISSQIAAHQRFGGVVPEVASRKHVEMITLMMEASIKEAGVRRDQLSAIAVTQGPGLVGALLVGVVAAKALSCAWELPFIGVHHIAGHIYANQLTDELLYPLIALVVSGGHTELVYMEQEGRFKVIGQTRDDAAGEAYDKVARALNMPYPGGPHVDKLAMASDGEIVMPRAWLEAESFDFSFSGLKSAVLNAINQASMRGEKLQQAHVARGFQESVIEVLVAKALRAVRQFGAKQLVLAGGVAANRGLRSKLAEHCALAGIPLIVPPVTLCTDNAGMIGAAAYVKWKRGSFTGLDMKADPGLSLEAWGQL